jgi:hypothetical protein
MVLGWVSPSALAWSQWGPAWPHRASECFSLGSWHRRGANYLPVLFTHPLGLLARTRTAPILHLVPTFHSKASTADQAPDLMLWLSDPGGPVGGPALFEIDVVLLKPRTHMTSRSLARFTRAHFRRA